MSRMNNKAFMSKRRNTRQNALTRQTWCILQLTETFKKSTLSTHTLKSRKVLHCISTHAMCSAENHLWNVLLSIIHVMWQSTYVTHTYVHPIYVYCNSTHKHVAIHTQSTYTRRSCDVHGNKSPLLHLPFPLTPPIAGNGNGSTTGRLHWMSLSSQAGTSLWPHWGVTLTPSLNSELKTIKVEKVGTLVLDQWWDCTSLSYKEVYCNLKWTNKQHLCPKENQSILQLKRDSI